MSLAPHVLLDAGLDGAQDGDVLPVPDPTLHHLRRVLRLPAGAAVSLTDGAGRSADATLTGDGVRLVGAVRSGDAPHVRLVLVQALSKGRRAEDAVRVACELGVDRIVPLVAARTQGRQDARASAALVTRWEAVAAAALEQSRGVWRAAVDAPVGVDALLAVPSTALRLVAVPGAAALSTVLSGIGRTASSAPSVGEVMVAVGPEGGWSPEELAAFATAGWRAVGLGPSVLRTEHAGPVAVAVLAALLGRWDAGTSAVGEGGSGATLPDPSVEEPRPPVSGPL